MRRRKLTEPCLVRRRLTENYLGRRRLTKKLPCSQANEDLIKRIMAVAGDTIQVKKGVTYINGPAPPHSGLRRDVSDQILTKIG